MAARRLLVVMIVLLVLSTLAAALVPIDRQRDRSASTTTTTTTTTTAATRPSGQLIERTINAARRKLTAVRVAVGDQLALTVTSPRPDQVEIPGFGELEDVDPNFAAQFDLLAVEPGHYQVRLFEAERRIGTIVVTAAGGTQRPAGHKLRPTRPAS